MRSTAWLAAPVLLARAEVTTTELKCHNGVKPQMSGGILTSSLCFALILQWDVDTAALADANRRCATLTKLLAIEKEANAQALKVIDGIQNADISDFSDSDLRVACCCLSCGDGGVPVLTRLPSHPNRRF
jgi:hypothetical protein